MPVLPNPKHERFCQELAKGKTQDEAYQLAGYKPSASNASTLRSNQNIDARIAELLDKAAQFVAVTVESIALQLDEDRQLAHSVGQPASAVAASMAKAKLFGLAPDKVHHSGPNDGPIQHEEVSALDRLSNRMTELAGRQPETKH